VESPNEAAGFSESVGARPSSTILKNAALVTGGDVALKAITFLFNVYVIRRLGDDRFGQYSIVIAFVGMFSIFVELGLTQYVMREIAKDRTKADQYFWNLVVIRFLLALVGIVGITLTGSLLDYPPQIVLGIFLYTSSFLLAAFQAPIVALLTAYERFDFEVLMSMAGRVVFVMLGGIFLLNDLSYIYLIVASLISFPAQIVIGLRATRRMGILPRDRSIDLSIWLDLVKASLPFGIISLMLTIAFGIDTVMLSRFQPANVVGWYNVAYRLVFSLLFLSKGIKRSMIPSLSRSYVRDPAYVERWYQRSVKLMAMISLPIAVGGTVLAFPLIRFLYTDEFLPSALALQILIWDVPLLMFASFSGTMTTIVSEERAAARIYSINTVANVLLNLYAIPRFGLVGAALVTVVTDLIGSLQFYAFLRRKLKVPSVVSVLVRAVVAAGLMGIVVWLVDGWNLFLAIGLGAIVYFLLATALRLFDTWERDLARSLIRRVVLLLRPRQAPS
jgi:O-antigen/teichoic acid export membrane protein